MSEKSTRKALDYAVEFKAARYRSVFGPELHYWSRKTLRRGTLSAYRRRKRRFGLKVNTLRSPLKVFLTIDTEVYPMYPDWRDSGLQKDIQRDIYGIAGLGEFGLRYQIKVLNRYGLRAVFFVESLFASSPFVGMKPLHEIVGEIQSSGHDVQLHLHPEWTAYIPALSHIPPVPMADLKRDQQRDLFRVGIANLRDAGAIIPCAFRAGDYAANLDTLKAASESGITFDSSYNYCYRGSACKLAAGCGPLLQPERLADVCELPISFFEDRPSHHRHAQVCAVSFPEMRSALEKAYEKGWGTFVIVFHSFELIKNRRSGHDPALRRIVRRRFEDLCRFLSENRTRFQTCVFQGLIPSDIEVGQPADMLKGSIVRTLFRYAEQAAGRIW